MELKLMVAPFIKFCRIRFSIASNVVFEDQSRGLLNVLSRSYRRGSISRVIDQVG